MVNILSENNEIQEMKSNLSELEIHTIVNSNITSKDLNMFLSRRDHINKEYDKTEEEESEETPYINVSDEIRAFLMKCNVKALETIKEGLAKKEEILNELSKKEKE